MSSANAVRICMAESLRFLEEGSSAPGQSGAKVRPNGVADAQTVEIPSPPKELNTGTHIKSRSRVLVPVAIEGSYYRSPRWKMARKAVWISAVPVPQTDTGR